MKILKNYAHFIRKIFNSNIELVSIFPIFQQYSLPVSLSLSLSLSQREGESERTEQY